MIRLLQVAMLLSMVWLNGCGGGSGTSVSAAPSETTPTTEDKIEDETQTALEKLSISGKATYDYVPVSDDGLDFAHTQARAIRYATVVLLDASGNTIAKTHTDTKGAYRFNGIAPNSKVKVRLLAMLERSKPLWDFKVVDNTDNNATYAIEGLLASIGESNQTRNLHAASGWDPQRQTYTTTRAAAPFAILDDIYQVISLIQSADNATDFAPLQVNWSPQNKALYGDISKGEIFTTYYQNGNLYILGDAEDDTDEYDSHVITHELGHYYEDLFSRSDSIGGGHGTDQILDIRVAFSEGWGNAFSAMSLHDPHYCDTYFIDDESGGWGFNIEDDETQNPGWFSEGSIQRILYDLWDSQNDTQNNDTLSLGFSPIHTVMTTTQKQTEAFTSLFSFIDALKAKFPQERDAIDSIVANESIATINDAYGTGRENRANEYPYHLLGTNETIIVSTYTDNGYFNKLGNSQLIKLSITEAGEYTIAIKQNNGNGTDPLFYLYKALPHQLIMIGNRRQDNQEKITCYLQEGDYLMDIRDLHNISHAAFSLTLTPQ